MLGDTGANALGAALGVAAVLTVSPRHASVVVVVLLVLTLLSEVVSFSKVIGGSRRSALDRARAPPGGAHIVIAAHPPLRSSSCLAVGLLGAAASARRPPARTTRPPPEDPTPATRPGRLLVFSVPGVTWADVAGATTLPNLAGPLRPMPPWPTWPRGGVRPVGPRRRVPHDLGRQPGHHRARRSTARCWRSTRRAPAPTAGDIFTRRTGDDPTGRFVSLTWPTLVRINDAEPFETELGSLTETLDDGAASPPR